MVTKNIYIKFRNENPDPIHLCYVLHNYYNRTKLPNVLIFQEYLTKWLEKKGQNIIAGTLTIKNFFDEKFVL